MHIRELTVEDMERVRSILSEYTLSGYTRNAVRYISSTLDSDTHTHLGAERDGVLVGFFSSVTYGPDTPPTQFKIRHPKVVEYPSGTLTLLKYGYVEPELTGNGIGTRLLIRTVTTVLDEHGTDALFAETWVKPDKKSSDQLLEKLGFEQAYQSSDYYDTYGENHDGVCSGCGNNVSRCNCSGAIYFHTSPDKLVQSAV